MGDKEAVKTMCSFIDALSAASNARREGDKDMWEYHLINALKVGAFNDLFKGLIFWVTIPELRSDVSRENIDFSAEWAAGFLEFNHGESIGSVTALSDKDKADLYYRADSKTLFPHKINF